jgi:hypothetical protein
MFKTKLTLSVAYIFMLASNNSIRDTYALETVQYGKTETQIVCGKFGSAGF